MTYLLMLHLSLSITWVSLTIDDDFDIPAMEYEIDGQRSKFTYNGGIREIKK